MIKIKTVVSIGKSPAWNGRELGKIQVSSYKVADKVNEKLNVIVLVFDAGEKERMDKIYSKLKE